MAMRRTILNAAKLDSIKAKYDFKFLKSSEVANHSSEIEKLCRLELLCTQGTLIAQQDPKLPRYAKFANSYCMTVACKESNLHVAQMVINLRKVQLEPGNFVTASYVSSLRVHPQHRGAGLGFYMTDECERLVQSMGSKFGYMSIFGANFSINLAYQLGYELCISAPYQGINVASAFQRLKPSNFKGISTRKLDHSESHEFLKKSHLAKSFLFPDYTSNSLTCNVYIAENGSHYAALCVQALPNWWSFAGISNADHLKFYARSIGNSISPSAFEKPISYAKPWRVHWAIPFVYNIGKGQEMEQFFTSLMSFVVRDLHQQGVALVTLSTSPSLGAVHPEDETMVAKTCQLSGLYIQNSTLHWLVKNLESDAEKAKKMMDYIKKQTFWFLDGKEM